MIAKFDTYNNYDDLVVSLRQPSDEFIDFVEVRDINISPEFNAVSEMSCTIYKIDNLTETYDAVEVKRQLYVEDRGYFIITACEDYKDDEGEYKSLTLLSCEHELSYKKLNYFKGTYKFYGTFTDEEGNEKRGLMDEIMQSLPRWSIAHIDDAVAERWRTFDEPDTTLYAFLMEDCEESYECIFEFDIKTKEIYVYDKNNYIKKTTICLSREDVISSIKTNTKVENIYTAISIYGEDDITINSLNPLGTATLYNFSYYKPWMSESLRNKLTIWENKIKTYEPEMETNRNSLATLMTELQSIQTDINTANEKITLYEKQMGVDSINEESIVSLNTLITEQRSLLEQYNTNKNNKEAEINTLQERFNTIYADCSFETNFTVDEIKELDAYIYESSYVEDNLNITENMTYAEEYDIIKQLYDKGKEVSENLGYPAEELTIDTNNFIFQKEFADYTEQLETGCLIDIALDDDNIVTYVLLKIDVNYEDKTVALTLGNKYRTSDAQALFKDWQANVSNAASTLTYERSKYGKAVNSGSLDRMNSFMQSSLDLTLNAVKASDGQSMEITESGLKGRRINPDTNKVDPEQIWITSNNIVFTDNNWEDIKTAIGRLILPDGTIGYGINAEYLLGKWIIGENMEITNENGSFRITKDGIDASFSEQIQEEVEKAIEGLEVENNTNSTTASSPIVLTDSADGGYIGMNIYGRSTQKTRSGKNKFDEERAKKGSNYTSNSNIGVNWYTTTIDLLPNTEYTITRFANNISANRAFNLQFYLYEDTTNTLFYVNNGYNEPILNKKTLTFTTGESGKIYLAALYGNDERFTNLFSNIDIQIEEGSASTEYEQYGVSPSPEFSSEIESVGTYDETSGKYKILVNSTVNLVRYVEMGGAYTTDGTDMPSDTLYRTNYMKVTPNSKLYVYGFDISTTRNVRLFYYDKDKKYISTYLGTNYFDVTTPSNCYYIRANLDKSVVNYQNIVISYSPQDKYGETQALFKIQNGLNSVGDVKDEVDLARGVLIQRVGVIDLGTLNWSVSGSRFQANPLNAKHTDSAWSLANLLCTHYRVDYAQNTWSEVNDKRISINQNGVIHIVDKDYTDATSFKSAMSDVYLIYELATPIEIPLTEDEMAQYRALQTYNPTTVVSATDNALMYVEYYRNTTDGQALANANANNNQNTEALLKKYSDLEQTVDGFKIEVGETVTTNYDELKKNIDDVNTSLNKAIETQQAAISLNADGINQIWSKNYTTKDDVDNIISEQTESVIQRVGKLEGDVSGFKVDITTVQTDVDGLSTNINKHMQFTEDGLILGNSESSFKTQLTETELAFLDGDDKVAYISNKTMNITSAQVEDRFILGNYLYEKTANGLNVKYIRGGV